MKKSIVIVPNEWEQKTKYVGTSNQALYKVVTLLQNEGYDVMPPMFNYLFEKGNTLGNDKLNVLKEIDHVAYVYFSYDRQTIHVAAQKEIEEKYKAVFSHLEVFPEKGQLYMYDLTEKTIYKDEVSKEKESDTNSSGDEKKQITTSYEELRKIIAGELDKRFNALFENLQKDWNDGQPKEEEEVWVNAEQVAKSVGISVGSVYSHARFKGLPHTKKGEAYRFKLSDVYGFYQTKYPRKNFPKS